MRKLIQYWLPVAVWTAAILQASGRTFDAPHTTTWVERVLIAVGLHLSAATIYVINHMIRKAAHVTEYGILAALSFRAVREGRGGFVLRWALIALAIVLCVASCDELLQSFSPTRTSSPWDVLIDVCGAAVALLLIRLRSGLTADS
jgi:VanZ family protein